jgi:hypothetical protein
MPLAWDRSYDDRNQPAYYAGCRMTATGAAYDWRVIEIHNLMKTRGGWKIAGEATTPEIRAMRFRKSAEARAWVEAEVERRDAEARQEALAGDEVVGVGWIDDLTRGTDQYGR